MLVVFVTVNARPWMESEVFGRRVQYPVVVRVETHSWVSVLFKEGQTRVTKPLNQAPHNKPLPWPFERDGETMGELVNG